MVLLETDLSQSVGITIRGEPRSRLQRMHDAPGHVRHDDQHMLLKLISEIFGSREGETRCNDAFDPINV